MIHLFHGQDVYASRKELLSLKSKFSDQEIVTLDGKTTTETDLVQAVESETLFATQRLTVVENLFSKKLTKSPTELKKFIEIIRRLPKEAEVVFWEEKELTKSILSQLPKQTDVAIFKIQRQLFNFVESLRPGRVAEAIELFDQTLDNDVPELIFTMLVRQLRYLIMVKDLGKSVPELSPWQASKFTRQAQFFEMPKLLDLYRKLLDIDVKIKTSNTPFSLTEEIKLFLVSV